MRIITTEEQYRSLYDKVRVSDGLQKAYEELRQTQETVVQQERLRALGQMASGVAHDVNNALTPVVAYTELLLESEPGLSETTRHYLEIIKQAGEDIAQIVARMRAFSAAVPARKSCRKWTSTRSSPKSSNSPAPAGATFPNARALPSNLNSTWNSRCLGFGAMPASCGKPSSILSSIPWTPCPGAAPSPL